MNLRLLHAITSVNPAGGGPIEGLKQMSAAHARQGHTVEIISLDDPSSLWVKECPVKVHALGPAHTPFRYSRRVVPWLRAHGGDYDAVIVNGLWQYASFGVWRALQGSATPYFVFPHGMLDPWFRRTHPLKHLKKWMFWPWADYRVLRDAAAVLFTSEEERRLARQSFWLYRCRECVVSFGTSAPAGDPAIQRDLFLARFPPLRDKRVLLFLGRVHSKKGTDLLLKSFARVLKTTDPILAAPLRLVMAGPDDHAYAQRMKTLASSLGLDAHVTWTGMLSGDLKWGALRAADAFVLPSHQENFGVAVAEALACGVPVLISEQVNIWREIRSHDAGFVSSDDESGTTNLLEHWISADPEGLRAMGERGRSCFTDHFLVDRTAESLIDAMRGHGLIARASRSPTPEPVARFVSHANRSRVDQQS